MSALSKPDCSNETAKTAAPPKPPGGGRPTFRRFLALFAVFCVTAALLPAVASAHDPTTTQTEKQKRESYQVEVGEERVIDYYERVRVEPKWITVPAYNYTNVPQYEDVVTKKFVGNKKVRIPPYTKSERVAPFTKTVLVYGNKLTVKCTELVYGDPKSRICWPETVRVQTGTKTVPAYNYKQVPAYNYTNVPQYEDVVTKKFVGNKKVRIPPYTKSQEVFNYEQQPVYKTVKKYETRYRMVGTGEYETTTTHTPHACPDGQYGEPLSSEVWIHITTGEVKTKLTGSDLVSTYHKAGWKLVDSFHKCYEAVREQIPSLGKIIVNGLEYVVKGGKVVISGVEYVVENGKIVIDNVSDIGNTLKEAVIDGLEEALKQTARLAAQGICRDPITAAVAGTVVLAGALLAGVSGGASLAAGLLTSAWIGVACLNIKEWLETTDSDDDDSSQSVPAPASGLSASAGAGQIAVSWTASTTTPADGFGYRVQWKLTTQTWAEAAVQIADLDHGSDLAPSYTVTGLSNGSAYDVRVAVFNDNGVSDWISDQATPTAPAPGPASGLSLVAGDKQIAVSWSASATTPAAGFGYRVQWKLTTQAWGDAAVQSEDLDHGSDLATSHTITGLANGSAYGVRVAAFNADGFSDWVSGTATPTKPKPRPRPRPRPNAVPARPVSVAASCETSGTTAVLTITWSAPASSPAEITGYGWLAFPNTALNSKRGTVKASEGDQNGDYTITAQAEPGKRYSVAVYSASANNRSNYTLSVKAQCPS